MPPEAVFLGFAAFVRERKRRYLKKLAAMGLAGAATRLLVDVAFEHVERTAGMLEGIGSTMFDYVLVTASGRAVR